MSRALSFTRWLAIATLVVCVVWPRGASAEAPRTEAAAQKALRQAEDAYLSMAFAQGLVTLRRAEKACGDDRCKPETHAALLRDIGTFLFRQGDAAGAQSAFVAALKLAPAIDLNPSYDAKDLRVRWSAAKESLVVASQPGEGDFVHTPPREQKETTPLPIYVEYRGSEKLASVVVKYRSQGSTTWKRTPLARVGAGWGGNVPCVDVTLGVLRYYVQGLDASDLPTVASGSPKAPYAVPIHETLSGEPPALPGMRAPETCADEDLATLRLELGDRCQEDNQCKSGVCQAGHCARAPEVPLAEGEYARFWLGVSGSVDVGFLPGGSDVCKMAGGVPANGSYFCTAPNGSDITSAQNDALVAGHAGQTNGGAASGPIRILGTLEYAASANLLVGVRLGYAAQSYPGQAALDAGRGAAAAFHGEARGTYLFGSDPLTLPRLVPYASLGAGYGRFDASTRVMVALTNVAGERPLQAWLVSGPFFASVGTGLRYALSPRIGFSIGARGTVAFGGGGVLGQVSPELALQYGL